MRKPIHDRRIAVLSESAPPTDTAHSHLSCALRPWNWTRCLSGFEILSSLEQTHLLSSHQGNESRSNERSLAYSFAPGSDAAGCESDALQVVGSVSSKFGLTMHSLSPDLSLVQILDWT